MKAFNSIKSIQRDLHFSRIKKSKIGFVPTMGALHQGHMKLVEESIKENDVTVVSIFVNPTQFNNKEDLKNYPNSISKDQGLLEEKGCQILFLPEVGEMYPSAPKVNFSFGRLEREMEGRFRDGHFNGVALVVSKLLNIIQPDVAYFGQKDWQQYVIVRQLALDLNINTKIKSIPTVREANGLAMSSRNERLSGDQKERSSVIYDSLTKARKLLKESNNVQLVKDFIDAIFAQESGFSLEYFEIANAHSLQKIEKLKEVDLVILAIAVYVGQIRLIDNILLELD